MSPTSPLFSIQISPNQFFYAVDSTVLNYRYDYNEVGLMSSRSERIANRLEKYSYDKLDRLTKVTAGIIGQAGTSQSFSYSPNGNIEISGAGNYKYGTKPHAVTKITNAPVGSVSAVTYNHFNQPATITENNNQFSITYGADQQRSKILKSTNNVPVCTMHYISKYFECERVENTDSLTHFYYILGDHGAVALHIHSVPKQSDMVNDSITIGEETGVPGGPGGGIPKVGASAGKIYYIHRDHLGSICAITDANKNVVQNNRFDAWGNPLSLTGLTGFTLIKRGFTGHEHYPEFKIINMNARLYDPVIGRFFSPDNFVQIPEFTQAYNRYSYCLNNPLKYRDPTGNRYNPVYNHEGKYLGETSEGFTGKVLMYSGTENINWSSMNAADACKLDGVHTYDVIRSQLSGDAKSNIWTNIASHFEGMSVYDLKFTMKDMLGEKIGYAPSNTGYWSATRAFGAGFGRITGADNYGERYETTVENVASSIIIHEWYSHLKKDNGNLMKSHRLAYKNVINDPIFWEKTTDAFKHHNLDMLQDRTLKETGRSTVDKPYLNLYNKYVPGK